MELVDWNGIEQTLVDLTAAARREEMRRLRAEFKSTGTIAGFESFVAEYIGLAELSERGWTRTMIDRLMPEPDATSPNPKYRCAAPMKFYRLERVVEVERSAEFVERMAKSERRRDAAAKGLATKIDRMQQQLDALKITVAKLDRARVIRMACDHFNARRDCGDVTDSNYATPNADPAFIERTCVNFARHCLTEYHDTLDRFKGQAGGYYHAVKAAVLDAISETYPWLRNECDRQKNVLLCTAA